MEVVVMTNEWQEFKAYTNKPTYSAANKHDLAYLGRFTFKTITDYEGLGRILTIIARGYLFKENENPYERIEYARAALCTWCSIPEETKKCPGRKAKSESKLFGSCLRISGACG